MRLGALCGAETWCDATYSSSRAAGHQFQSLLLAPADSALIEWQLNTREKGRGELPFLAPASRTIDNDGITGMNIFLAFLVAQTHPHTSPVE